MMPYFLESVTMLHDNKTFVSVINQGPSEEEIIMSYIGGPNITSRPVENGRGWYKCQKRRWDNRSGGQRDVDPQASESRLSPEPGKARNKISSRASRKGAVILHLTSRNVC